MGATIDRLYQLPSPRGSHVTQVVSCNKTFVSTILWHDQLGLPHCDIVKHVTHSMNNSLTSITSIELCNSCQLAKAYRIPLTHVHTRSISPFDIIHVDI